MLNENNALSGSGGGTRTPDTRIMMQPPRAADQSLIASKVVKPATGNQRLTADLSNRGSPPEKQTAAPTGIGSGGENGLARQAKSGGEDNPEQRIGARRSADYDAELIALDAVIDFAGVLCQQSAALLAAAASADLAATEAHLWTCKRVLTAAIASWREAVPANGRAA